MLLILVVLLSFLSVLHGLPSDCASMQDLKEMKQIENVTMLLPEVLSAYRSVRDIAQNFEYTGIPTEGDILSPAMVVILGAHSTGKSSLINVILQQSIQEQGLAPLHDSFTVFQYSPNTDLITTAFEKAGCDVLPDHNSPFHGLWKFDHFCSKFQERHVHNELLKRITLVDTPGMIDSAKTHKYDFGGVVEWYAKKADLIVFMYEPGQPATVREANHFYQILNTKYSQKLMVLLNMMNKYTSMADLTKGLHGFGSQLSPLEDNKDTKQIYYTYFCDLSKPQTAVIAMEDFKMDGEKVLKRILDVPIQHGYSTLSHLQNYLIGLNLHLLYLDHAQTTLARTAPFSHFVPAGALFVVLAIALGVAFRKLPRRLFWPSLALAVALLVYPLYTGYASYIKACNEYDFTHENLDDDLRPVSAVKSSNKIAEPSPSFTDLEKFVFSSLWSPGSTNNAAYLETQWKEARKYTQKLLQSPSFKNLQPVKPNLARVQRALNESVPYLYSLVNLLSPTTVPQPTALKNSAVSSHAGNIFVAVLIALVAVIGMD